MVDWVNKAMGYGDDEANEAIRLSWCHMTPEVEWEAVASRRVKGFAPRDRFAPRDGG